MGPNNIPSSWLSMPLNVLKDTTERMKAINDLKAQEHRTNVQAQKEVEHQGDVQQAQNEAMKDRLPFLDRG